MAAKNAKPDFIHKWIMGFPIVPAEQFCSCPIETSLGVLGKKWTMLVLRDIAMRKMERFSELMKSIPGITPRMLSARLREMERSGMISRVEDHKTPRFVRWNLTDKGWDTLPILMSYVAFGSKWYASQVFEDKKPREMNELYLQKNLKDMYVNIDVDKAQMRKVFREEEQNSWK